MSFYDLLPYVGTGAGAAIPLLFWRITTLNNEVDECHKKIKKLDRTINLFYFYLSKRDTNFSAFLAKHQSNL